MKLPTLEVGGAGRPWWRFTVSPPSPSGGERVVSATQGTGHVHDWGITRVAFGAARLGAAFHPTDVQVALTWVEAQGLQARGGKAYAPPPPFTTRDYRLARAALSDPRLYALFSAADDVRTRELERFRRAHDEGRLVPFPAQPVEPYLVRTYRRYPNMPIYWQNYIGDPVLIFPCPTDSPPIVPGDVMTLDRNSGWNPGSYGRMLEITAPVNSHHPLTMFARDEVWLLIQRMLREGMRVTEVRRRPDCRRYRAEEF